MQVIVNAANVTRPTSQSVLQQHHHHLNNYMIGNNNGNNNRASVSATIAPSKAVRSLRQTYLSTLESLGAQLYKLQSELWTYHLEFLIHRNHHIRIYIYAIFNQDTVIFKSGHWGNNTTLLRIVWRLYFCDFILE